MRGLVTFFNTPKGFGFIQPDEGGADVYIHYSDILGEGYKTLSKGDIVEFDVEQRADGKKLFARNLNVIEFAGAAGVRAAVITGYAVNGKPRLLPDGDDFNKHQARVIGDLRYALNHDVGKITIEVMLEEVEDAG